jgi:hypothetical protein
VFVVKEEAIANLSCVPKNGLQDCKSSKVNVDPIISFDQARFDELAAQLGEASVPLAQYATLEFSLVWINSQPSLRTKRRHLTHDR